MKRIIIISVPLLLSIAFFSSCNSSEPQLGNYVYVDKLSILHARHDCPSVATRGGARPIVRVALQDICRSSYALECSVCVTDNMHDSILHNMKDDRKRKELYDNLINEGYDLPGYNQFSLDMTDSNNMHRLYTNLINEGYELPDYNTFRTDMGYPDQPK